MKLSLFRQSDVGADDGSDSGRTNQAYAPAVFGIAPRVMRSSGRDQRRLEYANAVAPVCSVMLIVSPFEARGTNCDAAHAHRKAILMANSTGEYALSARLSRKGSAGGSGGWARKRGRTPRCGWAACTRNGWHR